MTAEASRTARPPWATICWADDTHIFTEVPCLSGPPLIQKYALTEGGLSRALAFLRDFHREHQPKGGEFRILKQANITRAKPQYSDDERKKAQEILRRMKII